MNIPKFNGRTRIALMVIAAVTLQALVIHRLRIAGLIDQIIPWDECAYIYMGISNAFAIKLGIWSGLQYAHSPLAIVPATVVALIIPQSGTAPYWVNFLYLIGLFVLIERSLKRYSFSAVAAFALVMVTTPFMFVFTSHIKTDFHGGVLLFALLSMLFRQEGEAETPFWLIAVFAIVILLAKPMAFYLPVLLAAVFVLSAFNQLMAAGHIVRHELARAAMLIAITLVAYALLVLPNLSYFKEYIAQALSPLWASDLPLWSKLAYYLPFVNIGQLDNPDRFGFWGRNYIAFAAIILAFVLTNRKSSVWRAAALLGCIAIIALIPAVASPQQQWSFGSFFAGAVMALLFYMLRAVQRTNHARALNWLIIVASIFVFSLPVAQIQTWVPQDAKSRAQAKAITDDFVAKMNPYQAENPAHPAVFFTFVGPIPSFDIGIRYYKQYRTIPAGLNESYAIDSSIIDGGLRSFAYIVMLSDGSRLSQIMESSRDVEAYQQRIKAAWNLEKLSGLPYAGTTYSLYRIISKKSH